MKKGVLSPVDTVGYWTEVKLDLVKRYANQYSVILAKQDRLCHVYIDAFSGPGVNISRSTGKMVKGSPLNALLADPPFCEYYLIDKAGDKIERLRRVIDSYPNKERAQICVGDSNDILLNEILPTITWNSYRRALCFLDPYGMQVSWQVVKMAGELGTVDLIINLPIMAINRNALRMRPTEQAIAAMNVFWGDDSWLQDLRSEEVDLFGETYSQKHPNTQVVEAYRKRLKATAGFKFVSRALPMRNSKSGIVFYLILASQYEVASRIADFIFVKYEKTGKH